MGSLRFKDKGRGCRAWCVDREVGGGGCIGGFVFLIGF